MSKVHASFFTNLVMVGVHIHLSSRKFYTCTVHKLPIQNQRSYALHCPSALKTPLLCLNLSILFVSYIDILLP
jgi:hypothetical protein